MKIRRRGQRVEVYQSFRQDGKVRTRYVGSGPAALRLVEQDLTARIDAIRERDRDRDQDRSLDGWSRDVEQFVRAVLTIAGFHRHHRGQWRRTVDPTTPAIQPQPVRRPLSPEVEAIRARVARGDLDLTSAEARKLIQAIPEFATLNQTPADDLLDCLVRRYHGHVIQQESVRAQVEQVRADLVGPNPTRMEALLAERAAVCWLACNVHERAAEQAQNLTPADGRYRQRKIDGAHRRFLSAVKTLATVRKLRLPDLMVVIDRRAERAGGRAVQPDERVIEIEPRTRAGLD